MRAVLCCAVLCYACIISPGAGADRGRGSATLCSGVLARMLPPSATLIPRPQPHPLHLHLILLGAKSSSSLGPSHAPAPPPHHTHTHTGHPPHCPPLALQAVLYMLVKLVLVPALMVGCAAMVGLEGAYARSAVILAALPVSSATFALCKARGQGQGPDTGSCGAGGTSGGRAFLRASQALVAEHMRPSGSEGGPAHHSPSHRVLAIDDPPHQRTHHHMPPNRLPTPSPTQTAP